MKFVGANPKRLSWRMAAKRGNDVVVYPAVLEPVKDVFYGRVDQQARAFNESIADLMVEYPLKMPNIVVAGTIKFTENIDRAYRRWSLYIDVTTDGLAYKMVVESFAKALVLGQDKKSGFELKPDGLFGYFTFHRLQRQYCLEPWTDLDWVNNVDTDCEKVRNGIQ